MLNRVSIYIYIYIYVCPVFHFPFLPWLISSLILIFLAHVPIVVVWTSVLENVWSSKKVCHFYSFCFLPSTLFPLVLYGCVSSPGLTVSLPGLSAVVASLHGSVAVESDLSYVVAGHSPCPSTTAGYSPCSSAAAGHSPVPLPVIYVFICCHMRFGCFSCRLMSI